jgi:hypothetical protein
MTPDAQRIAIAEACGLGDYDTNMSGWHDEHVLGLPDYLNNLNAMHEAEKVLLNRQRRAYGEMLIKVHPLHYDPTIRVEDDNLNDNYMKLFLIANMTAAQRAEAFLRTLSKWKEASK